MVKKKDYSDSPKSIYERSNVSTINSCFIKSYRFFYVVFAAIIVFGAIVDITSILVSVKEWFHSLIDNEQFSMLSIIVTLLSVIMATFSVIFGNFKICNINANLVLKQLQNKDKKNDTVEIVAVLMITPFAMIAAFMLGLDTLYFCLFIIAFFNLFLMLDICLTLFTDNGVKYVEIPENISRELQETVCSRLNENEVSYGRRERLLYDSYVQGITCDDYSVNRIVVPSVVLKNMELKYSEKLSTSDKRATKKHMLPEKKACLIYKNTYRFFRDISRYLNRNTADFSDYLEVYYGLCYNTLMTVVFEQIKEHDEAEIYNNTLVPKELLLGFFGVFLALFRNITEILYMTDQEENVKAYSYEIIKYLNRINLTKTVYYSSANKAALVRVRAIVWLLILYQMEYSFSADDIQDKISSDVYCNIRDAVEFFFRETIVSVLLLKKTEKDNSVTVEEKVKAVFKEAQQIYCQLSCGMLDNVYEKTFNLNSTDTVGSVERINNDLNSYLGLRPDHEEKKLIMSNFCFVNEMFREGGKQK